MMALVLKLCKMLPRALKMSRSPEVSLVQLSAKPLCHNIHIGHGGTHANDLQTLMGGIRSLLWIWAVCCEPKLGQEQLQQVTSLTFTNL